MQVIDPTFAAYHVDGTSWDIYDPVANIAAACNYAAHRYGSIDNVFGAY
jgi:SLT domain-containing protein